MSEQLLALFQRYFWEDGNIQFVYTRSADRLVRARTVYNEQYDIAGGEPAAATAELSGLMIAAALAAESQIDRETWGWTIRLPFRRWGMFCGVETDGAICCGSTKLKPEAAKDVVGAVAVQRVADNTPSRQSMLIPRDTKSYLIVEQYFDESEQLPARIAFNPSENEALLALSMPDAKWDQIENLTESRLIGMFHELCGTGETDAPELVAQEQQDARLAMLRKQYDPLRSNVNKKCGNLVCTHEAVFYYGCRCSEEMMKKMISSLPSEHQAELWHGTKELEIVCPRCGRKHIIHK